MIPDHKSGIDGSSDFKSALNEIGLMFLLYAEDASSLSPQRRDVDTMSWIS